MSQMRKNHVHSNDFRLPNEIGISNISKSHTNTIMRAPPHATVCVIFQAFKKEVLGKGEGVHDVVQWY